MSEAKVVMFGGVDQSVREVFWEHVPPGFRVVWLEAKLCTEDDVIEQVRDADFLFVTRSRVPERALREAQRLKLIQTFSQGYDSVPVRLATECGIPVANVGGANSVPTAEHAILLMLSVLRSIHPTVRAAREGKTAVDLSRRLYHQLKGRTVGIIGLGGIGRLVARMLRGFDVRVICHTRSPVPPSVQYELNVHPVGLEELLRTADIVSLHVPLLEDTRRMIGEKQLAMMKPTAILINTSRGEVVDEAALIAALREKRIAGAGLDVFAREPPALDNPLLSMDNVVATPHIGGYAWEILDARFDIVWGNVQRVWRGEPPQNVVNQPWHSPAEGTST